MIFVTVGTGTRYFAPVPGTSAAESMLSQMVSTILCYRDFHFTDFCNFPEYSVGFFFISKITNFTNP